MSSRVPRARCRGRCASQPAWRVFHAAHLQSSAQTSWLYMSPSHDFVLQGPCLGTLRGIYASAFQLPTQSGFCFAAGPSAILDISHLASSHPLTSLRSPTTSPPDCVVAKYRRAFSPHSSTIRSKVMGPLCETGSPTTPAPRMLAADRLKAQPRKITSISRSFPRS